MNRKMVFFTIGKIVFTSSLLMVLPAVVSLFYNEYHVLYSFLITIGIAAVLGSLITKISKPKDRVIYAKEGFIIVSLAWLSLSAIGALPFFISGEIPNYTDAFFETVSGFTTTGASILTDVEAMSHGLLFWRSFTHWIGGMGVLVFIMAVIPNISDRSIHIMRAEMPGPIVGKLVPRAKDTAKILYLIYIGLTAVEILFLLCGDMTLFESVVHTFGTAGTGGFGIKATSIAGYSSYSQWVIAIFMLLFGVNFNVYYLILIRRFRSVMRSAELWCYIGIIFVSISAVCYNVLSVVPDFFDALRVSAFQVISIITTTGYSTTNFDNWPGFSKAILFVLMFIGGCAGSTAGGLKVARVVILFKKIKKELRRMLHPRSVNTVSFEGRSVDERTLDGITVYFAIYIFLFFAIFLLLSAEPFNLETNISAVTACFNNVGPGFSRVGPLFAYDAYSPYAKWVLSFAMLFGRLEIYPLILALSPSTWSKNK